MTADLPAPRRGDPASPPAGATAPARAAVAADAAVPGASVQTPPPVPVVVRAGRRELGVVLVLDAAGAALTLLAAGRAWLRLTAARQAPLPDVTATLSGKAVEPLVPALGVVGLAGLVALLATRGRARPGVGALLAACGALLAVRALGRIAGPTQADALGLLSDADKASGISAGTAITATTSPIWPVLATVAGLAMLAGGVIVLLRSRHWPGMSARYDAPATAVRSASPAPEAVWDALDRGDDPTAS